MVGIAPDPARAGFRGPLLQRVDACGTKTTESRNRSPMADFGPSWPILNPHKCIAFMEFQAIFDHPQVLIKNRTVTLSPSQPTSVGEPGWDFPRSFLPVNWPFQPH